MAANANRIPVYSEAGPWREFSASNPSLDDSRSATDEEAYFSEPCSPALDQLRENTIPLREIKALVRRVQAAHEKKMKEKSRKKENKKKKRKEVMERLQSRKEDAKELLSVVEIEEDEINKLSSGKVWALLKQQVGGYVTRERELLMEIRDRVLIRNQDGAMRASVQDRLTKLREEIAADEVFSAPLRKMHLERMDYAMALTVG
ncbi:hypothetical protein GQ602_001054 [Ophiocordyceps camponoti-floridani]|uniref:Uncharacterized protein n=1 Tax=Ophiocordyceps camponoti-floridani TaxID=2030778 RepID=A0A8H4VH26_9HYPO|nr:hypothetical protein GQ602_001054 [Ophiocordyceps camponoti-floridani]